MFLIYSYYFNHQQKYFLNKSKIKHTKLLTINYIKFYSLQALEGTYIDKKCPFTGNVSIRGRILTGVVQKMKMQRTIVIRRDYLHYIRKYNRFEKRHRNMSVHLSPCFRYLVFLLYFSNSLNLLFTHDDTYDGLLTNIYF